MRYLSNCSSSASESVKIFYADSLLLGPHWRTNNSVGFMMDANTTQHQLFHHRKVMGTLVRVSKRSMEHYATSIVSASQGDGHMSEGQ